MTGHAWPLMCMSALMHAYTCGSLTLWRRVAALEGLRRRSVVPELYDAMAAAFVKADEAAQI